MELHKKQRKDKAVESAVERKEKRKFEVGVRVRFLRKTTKYNVQRRGGEKPKKDTKKQRTSKTSFCYCNCCAARCCRLPSCVQTNNKRTKEQMLTLTTQKQSAMLWRAKERNKWGCGKGKKRWGHVWAFSVLLLFGRNFHSQGVIATARESDSAAPPKQPRNAMRSSVLPVTVNCSKTPTNKQKMRYAREGVVNLWRERRRRSWKVAWHPCLFTTNQKHTWADFMFSMGFREWQARQW